MATRAKMGPDQSQEAGTPSGSAAGMQTQEFRLSSAALLDTLAGNWIASGAAET